MGVFARLFRRSKATEETPAAEARADAPQAGTDAAGKADAAARAGAAQAERPAGAPDAAQPAAAQATGTEGVDIPKQQSTGKAADNEAGEGART
jgi:hypothetical protein